MLQLIIAVALLGLAVGTYTDLKTREVPDWLNFGLIIAGIGLRSIWALTTLDWTILLNGILGLGIFFLVSSAMYYSGQWGGGDSKLLMGIGAMMGLDIPREYFLYNMPDLVIFWIMLLMIGAIYGLGVSFYLSLRNRKAMIAELVPAFRKSRAHLIFAIVVGLGLLLIGYLIPDPFIRLASVSLAGIAVLTYFLFIFVRAVEKVCMIKDISVQNLVEGDWVAEPVLVDDLEVCGPKDKGIDREQISLLQKLAEKGKINTIRVKEGIPFVPPFLIAFILVWVWPIKVVLF